MSAEAIVAIPSVRELLDAAARACAHWKDSPEACRAMKADCLATLPHLREDLIQHFETAYQQPITAPLNQ